LEFSAAVGPFGTVGTKEVLNLIGIPVFIARKPLVIEESLSSEPMDGIRKIMQKLGTIE